MAARSIRTANDDLKSPEGSRATVATCAIGSESPRGLLALALSPGLTFGIRCFVNAFCRILKLSRYSYSIFAFSLRRLMGRSP